MLSFEILHVVPEGIMQLPLKRPVKPATHITYWLYQFLAYSRHNSCLSCLNICHAQTGRAYVDIGCADKLDRSRKSAAKCIQK